MCLGARSRRTLIDDPQAGKIVHYMKKKFPGLILTNLGGMRIPKEYGPHRIETVTFLPPATHGPPILVVGSSSILGRLTVVFPYYTRTFSKEAIDTFKKEVLARLKAIIREADS